MKAKKFIDGFEGLFTPTQETCAKAIEWHCPTLQSCWLVSSAQSAPTAEGLRAQLASTGKMCELVLVSDIYDPLEFRSKAAGIYSAAVRFNPSLHIECETLKDSMVTELKYQAKCRIRN